MGSRVWWPASPAGTLTDTRDTDSGGWWMFPVKGSELCDDAGAGEGPTKQGAAHGSAGWSLPARRTGPEGRGGIWSVFWLLIQAFLLEAQSFLSILHS